MLKPIMINLVTKALQAFLTTAKTKDKSNTGQRYAEWYFWCELSKLASNKAETIRDLMIADEILKDPKSYEEAGNYDMGECPAFVCTVAVSEKVRTFNPQELSKLLLKSHKVPIHATITAVELAKLPTSPRRTIKVIER